MSKILKSEQNEISNLIINICETINDDLIHITEWKNKLINLFNHFNIDENKIFNNKEVNIALNILKNIFTNLKKTLQ